MKCRHCAQAVEIPFVNLDSAPPSNAYLSEKNLVEAEKWFPLKVLVCSNCWLVQTEDNTSREELFLPDYAYFSSFSSSWLAHSKKYADDMIQRFSLDETSQVGEIAANDGYLLQYFQAADIPCFGVEPTISTAQSARQKGLHIIEKFFGQDLAKDLVDDGYRANLLIANNVLAHVPDINDFVAGFTLLLKPDGVATFEFPHLYRLVKELQFDTIYHEHFSYLSLYAVKRIFEQNGLAVFDVDELPTHGGSLRVFAQRMDRGVHATTEKVTRLLEREEKAGMTTPLFYTNFQKDIINVKREFLNFLLMAQARNEKVVGYGAAAKGNTLLNYSGVRSDLVNYAVDRNPAKQGKYLPGSRIPIKAEEALLQDKPDWIIIFPWNLRDEISAQLAYIRDWGGRFATVIPSVTLF